jgi:membrane-associated phospholipid phosphatase
VRSTILALVLALAFVPGRARADGVEHVGDVAAIALPAGAAVGALVAGDHHGLAELGEAFGSTMAVVYVLKPVIDRTRPNGGHQSFPSGHAASAFAGAAFLGRRYGWRLGVPAGLLATFTAWTRVESREHYATDVIAGAAIGIGANLVFTHRRTHAVVGFDSSPHRAGPLVTIVW